MFFMVGVLSLILLSITLYILWGHERLALKKMVSRANVEEYWDQDERRRHIRFKMDIEVEYNVEKKPHLKSGRSINISKSGMKLILDEKLPQGTIIDMKIYPHGKRETIEVEGEVVWTKDIEKRDASGKRYFYSGIKFLGIRESSGAHLDKYLNSLGPENYVTSA